jgi:DNA-binding NarL/FixJ family response regulator
MSSSNAPIRVVIVDDHPTVRDMLRLGSEDRPEIQIVGEGADGREALEACARLQPNVLVLDLILPGLDGFEVIRRLHDTGDPPRILVLTNRDDSKAALESIRLGVNGYLEKTAPMETLIDGIVAVGRGEEVFTPAYQQLAHQRLATLARQARAAARAEAMLSRRERDVLELIAGGLTARQMATRLQLSERTIETHISKVYQKLGVRTRVQAVHRGAALGLVDLSAPTPK